MGSRLEELPFLFHPPRVSELHNSRDTNVAGNRAILEHRKEGRALRLFQGAGGEVTYLGEFEVDAATPYYRTDAPETGDGPIREVIVFRLRPAGRVHRVEADKLQPSTIGALVSSVPVEAKNVEKFFVTPSAATVEAERREQALVHRYRDYLSAKGHKVVRHRYEPNQEAKPLFCDLFDETQANLVEAKGSAAREAIRMAIGQLFDYARLEAGSPAKGVLLPARPRQDLEELLRSVGVAVIWQTDDGFEDNAEGRFS